MAIDICPELSSYFVRLNFYDQDSAPVVPTCVLVRLDEVFQGREVRALAEISGTLASDMDLEITSTENAIYGDDPLREFRSVTALWSYGVGGARNGASKYVYKITDLQFVPSP
jgi:hypothetical protein